MGFVFSLLLNGCASFPSQKAVIENSNISLQFDDQLIGINSLIDKNTGRQYAPGTASPVYLLGFGKSYDSLKVISSGDADVSSFQCKENGIELVYRHDSMNLRVICKVSAAEDDSLLHWSIHVDNRSGETLCSVEYPVISCLPSLGEEARDDAFLFPVSEGVLLKGLGKENAGMSGRYPGKVSSQLMYWFDPSGGFYFAACDGEGYPKELKVKNRKDRLDISQKFLMPIETSPAGEMPYEVVTGCFGGRWEDGAAVYRHWSDKQSWTKETISRRRSPSWLRETNLFLNANLGGKYKSAAEAATMISGYHDFFETPVVTAVFGWEKHGTWIGPDYFPPRPDRQFYVNLVNILDKRGDHLQFYTSGFRWGVKKPINEKGLIPRVYTDYDGTAHFMAEGEKYAVKDQNNQMVFKQLRWADNYLMCAGSEGARNILDSCYSYIYSLGVAGVDLDQNIGGEVDDCYSSSHGHPRGAGLWQTRSMERFLSKIQSDNMNRGETYFQGVEEPCERYIPFFDVFHGRAFTATKWPVYGPGAVSVPLYLFLYHQYQIAYAGWIDGGFSPCGFEKYGLGRAYIFGMYPGIRAGGNMELREDAPSDELLMLKGYLHLMKEAPDFLLRGRMIGETEIEGSGPFDTLAGRGDEIPASWDAVQGITWFSEKGDRQGVALANLSYEKQNVRIRVEANDGLLFQLVSCWDGQSGRQQGLASREGWVELTMHPWELAFLRGEK